MTDNGATNQEHAESPVVPAELALLPIFNNIVYPLTMVPLAIGQESSIQLIDDALREGRMIGLVALKATDERPAEVTRDDFSRCKASSGS